jgi:hypothetical protein
MQKNGSMKKVNGVHFSEFIEFLRKKAKAREKKDHKGEETVFAAWPLGVKGKLTRRKIYDYL